MKLHNNIVMEEDFTNNPSNADNIPYLQNPPKVINVSVGRQLFVDDFLIENTNLTTEYHTAKKYENNPVLKAEMDWEKDPLPVACPKSGGVWYDEEEKIFKMWYEGGFLHHLCYATSKDGIHWERPNLKEVEGTNIILSYDGYAPTKPMGDIKYLRPDSTTFWIDYADKKQKYKLLLRNPGDEAPAILATSSDGIKFENFCYTDGEMGDRSTFFYNPFRNKWVYSLRYFHRYPNGACRDRRYWESDDFLNAGSWDDNTSKPWLAVDEKDTPNAYVNFVPQLYNADCIAYESIIFGLFQIHRGPENEDCELTGAPKITELVAMYSRDGYHFSRPSRENFIPASLYKGSWDRAYVQSVSGGLITVGDELRIYYTGFAGDEALKNKTWYLNGMYSNGATGYATLRKDGFASMNGCGELTTCALEMTGKASLHVNIDGKICAEILDETGNLIARSQEYNGNATDVELNFGEYDVSKLNNTVFKLRFLVDGKFYSFGFADKNGDFGGAHGAGVVLSCECK